MAQQKRLDDALRRAPIPEAIETLEQAIADSPGDTSLPGRRIDIVQRLRQENQLDQAAVQGEKLLEHLLDHDSIFSKYGALPFASYQVARIYSEMGDKQKGKETLERAQKAIAAGLEVHPSPTLKLAWLRQQYHMALWISEHESYEAADELLRKEQVPLEQDRGKWTPESDSLREWIYVIQSRLRLASQYDRQDLVGKLSRDADEAVSILVEQHLDSARAIEHLLDIRLDAVERSYRQSPEAARNLIRSTLEVVDRRTVEDILLQSKRSRLAAYEAKIEAALVAKTLIGKKSPDLKGTGWAAGLSQIPASIEGKVVVVDFWAMWCGPCIAGFPELDALHREFHAKGLEVIGVTRCYGFEWDTDAGEPVNKDNKDFEKEVDAVDRFLKLKKLSFPSIVDPLESSLFASFGVTGIPQTVVIDRKGVIQLLQIGHTEANRKALRELVEKLLVE